VAVIDARWRLKPFSNFRSVDARTIARRVECPLDPLLKAAVAALGGHAPLSRLFQRRSGYDDRRTGGAVSRRAHGARADGVPVWTSHLPPLGQATSPAAHPTAQ
jgi:hypothetical protein